MTDPSASDRSRAARGVIAVGRFVDGRVRGMRSFIATFGALAELLGQTLRSCGPALLRKKSRLGRESLLDQMVRVGVRSIGIVVLVQIFIGIIIALQMAPTLQQYGQLERVADVVGIAVVRELGPLITAIVLSGFAGASIAAEIGSMVEGEEIKALRAHAMNPVRFLVVPRFLATVVMLTGLCVIADIVGVLGGMITAVLVLDIGAPVYLEFTRQALKFSDFYGGLVKAAVFGLTISMIACHEGFSVSGGAEGVGRATTSTVVKSIVALIAVDVVFTIIFYVFKI
ncbi:MAG: putative phospholipid ABC transporter permease protein MlaE [Phycisphaerae bacterium]|nr:putative phospholipid ABC transporter permease protein MlaE [Phycisphaerae bacterium]